MKKKLYRSTRDRKIAGVCGGVAEYLNVDPTVVRAIWAVLGLCAFAGIGAYLVCILIIPEENNNIIDAN